MTVVWVLLIYFETGTPPGPTGAGWDVVGVYSTEAKCKAASVYDKRDPQRSNQYNDFRAGCRREILDVPEYCKNNWKSKAFPDCPEKPHAPVGKKPKPEIES